MSVENISLTDKIKADYGTLKFFCLKNGINYNTFKRVFYGQSSSKPIVNILKKHKYIKSADDIKRKVA